MHVSTQTWCLAEDLVHYPCRRDGFVSTESDEVFSMSHWEVVPGQLRCAVNKLSREWFRILKPLPHQVPVRVCQFKSTHPNGVGQSTNDPWIGVKTYGFWSSHHHWGLLIMGIKIPKAKSQNSVKLIELDKPFFNPLRISTSINDYDDMHWRTTVCISYLYDDHWVWYNTISISSTHNIYDPLISSICIIIVVSIISSTHTIINTITSITIIHMYHHCSLFIITIIIVLILLILLSL